MEPLPTSWEQLAVWFAGYLLLEARHWPLIIRRWLDARARVAEVEAESAESKRNLLEHEDDEKKRQ